MIQPAPAPRPCHPFLLATSPVGSVTLCPDCGVVQLNTDCVSIRMDAVVLEALTQMLVAARCHQQALQALETPLSPPKPEATTRAPVH